MKNAHFSEHIDYLLKISIFMRQFYDNKQKQNNSYKTKKKVLGPQFI